MSHDYPCADEVNPYPDQDGYQLDRIKPRPRYTLNGGESHALPCEGCGALPCLEGCRPGPVRVKLPTPAQEAARIQRDLDEGERWEREEGW